MNPASVTKATSVTIVTRWGVCPLLIVCNLGGLVRDRGASYAESALPWALGGGGERGGGGKPWVWGFRVPESGDPGEGGGVTGLTGKWRDMTGEPVSGSLPVLKGTPYKSRLW